MSITLNGTEGITLDNGSADGAQVTLASSGYSNWNLDNYSGRFRAYYNATEYFTINSSGNVGIGTNSPNTKVDSSQSTGFNYSATRTSSSGYNGLSFYENTTNTSYIVEFGSGAGGGQRLQMWTNTAFPIAFGTNNTERMRIDSSGNLLIGRTNNPSGFTSGLYVTGAYSTTTPSGANVFINTDGSFFRSTSSIKYKTNVENYAKGLDDLSKLRPVTYQAKEGINIEQVFAGFVAEEVHEAGLTEFVQYAEDGTPDALSYGNMVALCVKAIQEQQELIKSLTSRIETLETK